ncbi:MAG: methyltransferase domain-containing protein [Erysipelotrichaceae bacterium]
MLKCPICNQILNKSEHNYHCQNNHQYDIAKSGYVNLLIKNKKQQGDNKLLTQARDNFLKSDNYLPLKNYIKETAEQLQPNFVVDCGCNQGYYTQALYNNNQVYAFDLSINAIKIAAKKDKNITYFCANIFDIPIIDNTIDLVTNIFIPLSIDETLRILKKEGYFIVVTPAKNHLIQMKELLYPQVYLNEEKEINHPNLKLINKHVLTYNRTLNNSDLNNLFKMTPYYYKTSYENKDKLLNIPNLEITFSFCIQLYQKM